MIVFRTHDDDMRQVNAQKVCLRLFVRPEFPLSLLFGFPLEARASRKFDLFLALRCLSFPTAVLL